MEREWTKEQVEMKGRKQLSISHTDQISLHVYQWTYIIAEVIL